MINWKGFRKKLWPIRYYPRICLQGLSKTTQYKNICASSSSSSSSPSMLSNKVTDTMLLNEVGMKPTKMLKSSPFVNSIVNYIVTTCL
jgi:hypothetical protein